MYIYISIYIQERRGPGHSCPNQDGIPGSGGTFFDAGGFFRENGLVESFMRWVPTGRFEHSIRELLALYICRDAAVFVIHKRSLGVPGVPGASLRCLRNVPGGPRGVPGRPRGVPWCPRGAPEGPRGVPRGPRGVSRETPGSQGAPGTSQASPGSFS